MIRTLLELDGETYVDEGGDIGEDLSNQPINDPDD
jgi:hypothetical protein